MKKHVLLFVVALWVAVAPAGAVEIADEAPQVVATIIADLERRGFEIDAVVNNDPSFLARKHGVVGEEARLGNIANALRDIAQAAAGLVR